MLYMPNQENGLEAEQEEIIQEGGKRKKEEKDNGRKDKSINNLLIDKLRNLNNKIDNNIDNKNRKRI